MIGLAMLMAAQSVGGFVNGTQLYADCTSGDHVCAGYIIGVVDGYLLVKPRSLICLPANITRARVIVVALQYLKDHPSERKYTASSLVLKATGDAFPCPKS